MDFHSSYVAFERLRTRAHTSMSRNPEFWDSRVVKRLRPLSRLPVTRAPLPISSVPARLRPFLIAEYINSVEDFITVDLITAPDVEIGLGETTLYSLWYIAVYSLFEAPLDSSLRLASVMLDPQSFPVQVNQLEEFFELFEKVRKGAFRDPFFDPPLVPTQRDLDYFVSLFIKYVGFRP